jgi:hypothetical protein
MKKMRMLFDDNDDNVTCLPCPAGSYSNAQKMPNCTDLCDAGFCPSNITCPRCPRGTFSDTLNSTTCHRCDAGWVNEHDGSTNCSACLAGFTSTDDHTSCYPCSAGTFSAK